MNARRNEEAVRLLHRLRDLCEENSAMGEQINRWLAEIPTARSWVLSGWHEGSPGSGAVYVDGPVLAPGESVTVTEKEDAA